MTPQELEPLLFNQVRPKHRRTFFCRLCRQYHVRLPKAHLRDKHGADYRATQNKSYKDIIDIIFVRSV